MSRAFVKETDQEDLPLVPPRSHLPQGTPNYVTAQGMANLKQELQTLQTQKQTCIDDKEGAEDTRIKLYVLNEKIRMLQERIARAQEIDTQQQNPNEVHFGALVKLYNEDKHYIQIFKIVGVDEAKISDGKIAFISPLAQALTGKTTHQKAEVVLPIGKQTFTILSISYDD